MRRKANVSEVVEIFDNLLFLFLVQFDYITFRKPIGVIPYGFVNAFGFHAVLRRLAAATGAGRGGEIANYRRLKSPVIINKVPSGQ